MQEVSVRSPDGSAAWGLDRPAEAAFSERMARAAKKISGRTIWHVNSAAAGGGVAEMLLSLLPYIAAAGIRVRWLVVDADEEFFTITKQLHHLLHGSSGDGMRLESRERSVYEETLRSNLVGPLEEANGGDVVVLHDPQTVGLAPDLRARGCAVIWGCHIGADAPDDFTRAAWGFLTPYVDATAAQVFSRRAYVWDTLDTRRVAIIPPCIDACSAKNRPISDDAVDAILATAGIVDGDARVAPEFVRQDGTRSVVGARASVTEDERIPADAPLVAQVSRWDPLKDMSGVMHGFAEYVPLDAGAHLVLAGPSTSAVDDDPEAAGTLAAVRKDWENLPGPMRARVHLASLPMEDLEENAAIVNAVQRRAAVVAQKSLAEGFGLTVAEAMWKGRPTVGARVGGIQDQIVDGESGVLVDPTDLLAFGAAVAELLEDESLAADLGARAHERVREEYLAPRYLARSMDLIERVLE